MSAQLDHLVVVASGLQQGVAWCERVLGITPGPGGQHALMGTHNRLFSIATPQHPLAYFEIIAIDFEATNHRGYWANGENQHQSDQTGTLKRWFDMDNAEMNAQIARNGPQLVHFVVSVPHARASAQALADQHIDRGEVLFASRSTPNGMLEWQITVRPDGARLYQGCLPTLIQWGAAQALPGKATGPVHPSHAMAPSGVTLTGLGVCHPEAEALNKAYASLGLDLRATVGPANLSAQLQTPRGSVTLQSGGI